MKTLQDSILPGHILAQASAAAPGTCGELAQGLLDGTLVMVTCPIDLFATATVQLSAGAGLVRGPPNSPKATQAVTLTLRYLERTDLDARLHLESPLPRQKGMASSTADVVASVGATAAALNRHLSARQQADLALAIEPSDGTMFPGVALFAHRSGHIARSLGNPPSMGVVVLEYADAVDTEAFNAVDRRAASLSQSAQFLEAFQLITSGLERGDGRLIGRGATRNALAYQSVFPNPHLNSVLNLARMVEAVGVNVAHSGTVLGLLFLDDPEHMAWAALQAEATLSDLTATHQHRLIGGGVRPPPDGRLRLDPPGGETSRRQD